MIFQALQGSSPGFENWLGNAPGSLSFELGRGCSSLFKNHFETTADSGFGNLKSAHAAVLPLSHLSSDNEREQNLVPRAAAAKLGMATIPLLPRLPPTPWRWSGTPGRAACS